MVKRAKIKSSVTQNLPNAYPPGKIIATPLTFDTVEWDTGGFWDPTKPTGFTVPENGIYRIDYNVFQMESTETFDGIYTYALVTKNQTPGGVNFVLKNILHESQAIIRVDFSVLAGSFPTQLAAGDFIELNCCMAYNPNTIITGYNDLPFFSIEKTDDL